MKSLLLLAAILVALPIFARSQSWTNEYITASGDTVHKHDVIMFSPAGNYKHIYLKTAIKPEMRMMAARRFLADQMPGRSYSISRLTRIPKQGGYEEIAVVKIVDASIHRRMAVEYFIQLEEALKSGEVDIATSGKSAAGVAQSDSR